MQGQNPAPKVASRDVSGAVVALEVEESMVAHWSLLLWLPRLRWKAMLGTNRWSLLSSCTGLRAASFYFLPLLQE